MTLGPGTRLGPYEIATPLGSGGMGEVYKARDTRLDRTVALKVLPSELASDPEFRARFDREARAISQLSHPHICTIHDVGLHDGTPYLVMELLEGETLADRLARGTSGRPALTLTEALTFGRQIADALTAAHRKGIVHRDLKPGNIFLVRKSGSGAGVPTAKLLDFGLAKATVPSIVQGDVSLATTSPRPITTHGTILGTFQYMAPEQLEGAEADVRSDIFAFGCVLYEMLTGKRAFEGQTQASVIAAIIERDPAPLTTLQPLAPPLLDSIVGRCLAKKPEDRWQAAADLATALDWVSETPSSVHVTAAVPAVRALRHRKTVAIALALLTAVVLFGAGAALARYGTERAPTPQPMRFELLPPSGAVWSPAPVVSTTQLALSPDGFILAFVAARGGAPSQIWLRRMDRVEAVPLDGTEGASFPFWSPDSRFLAFFAGGKLKRIDISGGAAQTIAPAPNGRGGAWSAKGFIAFSAEANGPLFRVAADGGPVSIVVPLDPAKFATANNWPQFLPDGQHFLFYVRSTKSEFQGIYVADIESGASTSVLRTDGMAQYSNGHLLFVREGILFAVSFDERLMKVHGEPVRLAERVGYFAGTLGYASFSASPNVLVYGPLTVLTTSLQWRSRSGEVLSTPVRPGVYRSPRLSFDQRTVAVTVVDPANPSPDIWTVDLSRGAMSRITSDPNNDWFPAWSPDDRQLFLGSTGGVSLGDPGRSTAIYRQRAAGLQQDRTLIWSPPNGSASYPMDVTPDGQTLMLQQSVGGYDLKVISTTGSGEPRVIAATPFNEVQGRFSPDGRWVAYSSDETGRFEVYARPFPADGAVTRLSVAGGLQPEWRRDGRELYYIAADGMMTAVDVKPDSPSFEVGTPHSLFRVEIPEAAAPYPTDYAVAADGQKFLINTVVEQSSPPAVTIIGNWRAEIGKP